MTGCRLSLIPVAVLVLILHQPLQAALIDLLNVRWNLTAKTQLRILSKAGTRKCGGDRHDADDSVQLHWLPFDR